MLLKSYIEVNLKEMQMIGFVFVFIVIAFVLATDYLPRSDVNRFLSERVQDSVTTLKIMNG
jgi:hypothetical protein